MAGQRSFAFIPQFTVNSKQLNALPATARWVYVVMVAERRGRSDPFTFTYEDIKSITGFAQATIRQAVKELDEAGFLSYEHGGLERNPNSYTLNSDWLEL